jgi:hypothetical protein
MYSSPNIVRVIKSRIGWVGNAARMRKGEACTNFWCGNLRKKDHLEDPGLDRRIMLRLIFRKWDARARTGSSWLRIGTGDGHL